MQATTLSPSAKPLLRGLFHEIAAYIAFAAGVVLVFSARSSRVAVASGIYAASLTTLLAISALYHRPTWAEGPRRWMRRLDHCAIFLLIAGTYTPFSLLLEPRQSAALLTVAWGGAAAGILQALFWVRAPKPLIAVIYVALGWAVVPFVPALRAGLGQGGLLLIAAGGIIYSAGAVIYALKRPNPAPRVFGYHEIFHAMIIVAAALHFAAVAGIVRAVR